ncbi:MAG: hypothetical protein M3014_03485 [Chloroflexota bacterium]|nr:hypothetical protein [Chloroflexota bacterium]
MQRSKSIITQAVIVPEYNSLQPDSFTSHAPGQVRKTPQGYWAFLPNPLPPDIEASWDLTRRISEADRALSELAGIARTLPNPHLLIGPFIRREAVLSSRIEGTQASLSDLFLFEASGVSDPRMHMCEKLPTMSMPWNTVSNAWRNFLSVCAS